ncbi:Regulatory protein, MarR [Flavobacteriaceae bacterium 3519-10]|nr:Regulatory protein, MarR [Flavobacteriaceae bacterium 3519-10]
MYIFENKILQIMKTTTTDKVDNIDLILKSTWLSVSKMYSDLAQDHDATAVQALTLLKIDPKEGTRSTNLGPKMAIEPTSLTRIIKLLEDNGYIYKEKTANDKREVIIKLTDKGLNSRNLSKEVVVNFNKKVTEKISGEKLEVFKEVMADILKIANELNNKK